MPKENAPYNCLLLIMLNSFIRVNKTYYSQTFLEKRKYKIKNNKRIKGINLLMMI